MQSIVKRPRAGEDLIEIWLYIAQDSKFHADRMIDLFDKKFALLARNPEIGRFRLELLMPGLRSFPIQNYVVFYRQAENGIEIIRVLHGSRDIASLM